jgi:hypothetical protein
MYLTNSYWVADKNTANDDNYGGESVLFNRDTNLAVAHVFNNMCNLDERVVEQVQVVLYFDRLFETQRMIDALSPEMIERICVRKKLLKEVK